jgi:hypothetical protein
MPTSPAASSSDWPALPLAEWRDSYATLHLWTQIVGKIRMVKTPWLNHSWHVPLYVSARGLTTSPIPFGARLLEIEFDFTEHVLRLSRSDGEMRTVSLAPKPVAQFFAEVMAALAALDLPVRINEQPNEIADAIPFSQDRVHAAYDPEYANRFWRLLVQVNRVFSTFRTGFLGKASPVHFFWGSFDLAVTRFSGRRAPRHPGGVPNLPDSVAQEAYSHEVSSAGFWPGSAPVEEAAFYSYSYPAADGFAEWPVRPAQAFYSKDLGEFVLSYDAVRRAGDPDAVLLDFLQSTYEAAAETAHWDRAALECSFGRPGVVRSM